MNDLYLLSPEDEASAIQVEEVGGLIINTVRDASNIRHVRGALSFERGEL